MLIGCKHLDYDADKYEDCTIETLAPHYPEVRFWRRGQRWVDAGIHGKNPERVQFCRLRGRINGIFDCYNPGEMCCYEPPESG